MASELGARRAAIDRFLAGDDLAMAYQPIVDLRTRDTVGIEALARFAGPPAGSPDAWFAEAARLGLGGELEVAAVRLAVGRLASLPEHIFVAVNCSHRTAITHELREALADAGPRVVVEITEHEPVEDYGGLARALAGLRAGGVRIAIDDAGAGFASLRHARVLEPDLVKLDISLTRGIDRDRSRRESAATLISFAAAMGATIVAEGIETPLELETLLELGVPLGQGYLLGEPEVAL